MKKELKHCDILLCYSGSVLAKIIRGVTSSKYNHLAIVLKVNDSYMISESQMEGVSLIEFENWQKKYNYKFDIARLILTESESYDIEYKVITCANVVKYDFKNLLLHQIIKIKLKIWIGKIGKRATKKQICSEYIAYLIDMPDYYKASPEDVYQYLKKLPTCEIIIN